MNKYETLKVEKENGVARVGLNRPDVRNAFNDRLILELEDCFAALGGDAETRVIVLYGIGKHFCAGADVNWMKASVELSTEQNEEDARRMSGMLRGIDECRKPVIGRIHGAALGGGSGLASVCDIVVAQEEAVFAFSEVRLGILPAVISSFVLPKIGETNARRYFLTAERFSAHRAMEIGLIHEVTHSADLDDKVQELTQLILENGPNAVAEAKKLIRDVRPLNRDEKITHCVGTIARIRTSPEGQEGLKAFLEKRKASWIQ